MIHPHTYIHPNAKLATNVKVDPFTVIHHNVEIGEGTWIGSNVTIMEGARIGRNCRIFPGTSSEQVRTTLQEVAGSGARVEISDQTPEGPVSEPIPEVMAAITRSIHARHPNVPVSMMQESGATDGLWFRSNGIPTLGSSGGFAVPGSTFAHGLNETVTVEAFHAAVDHIHDLAVALGGTGRR